MQVGKLLDLAVYFCNPSTSKKEELINEDTKKHCRSIIELL